MISDECIIRRATSEDAAAIETLYRELTADPKVCVLTEQVGVLAESATAFLLVADCAGVVSGTALFTVCLDAMYQRQPFGLIENIVVAEKQRGCGIGGRLLAEAERLAVVHDCTKLMLLSAVRREAAHAFFRRAGFSGNSKRGFVKYRRQFHQ